MTKLTDAIIEGIEVNLKGECYLDLKADHLKVNAKFATGEGFECVMKLSFGSQIAVDMYVQGPEHNGKAFRAQLPVSALISFNNWTQTLKSLSQELEDEVCRGIGHKSQRMLDQEAIEEINQRKQKRSKYMEAFCKHYELAHPGYEHDLLRSNTDGTFSERKVENELLAFIAGAEFNAEQDESK